MPTGRNDPCPCGSGRKYKQCHGRAAREQASPEEAAWRRLRAANEGLPARMARFVDEVYGPGAIDEAWAEFTLWDEEAFDPESPHLQVFLPWFFHRWTPDPDDTLVADAALHGRSPTEVLLERRGRRLDPVLIRYLSACLEAPFSFHQVLSVDAGRGVRTRDVFSGDERDVMERSASRFMRPGDVFFGQMVTSDGVTIMEACSVHTFPPANKIHLVDLRERIGGGRPAPLTADDLDAWESELRLEYLELMEALRNPRLPRLQNTDGEPIAFHRLTFEVPSAQAAFDALKALAGDDPDLEPGELDAEGRLRRAAFPWIAAGNPMHPEGHTILGQIEIDGERLVATVNSAGRAARFKHLVASLYPAARHTGTEVESVEEAMAREGLEPGLPGEADPDPLSDLPEVREHLAAVMASHYERWLDEAIPALGGLTPLEAVEERGGREKVEALVAQIERDGVRMNPPLDPGLVRRLRERLGLAPAGEEGSGR